MRSTSRSPSVCNSRSGPVKDSDSSAPAMTTPMMTITTRISISVKPPLACWRGMCGTGRPLSGTGGALTGSGFDIHIPVANVGIFAFAAFLAVGAEGIQVVLVAVRAGIHILVVIAPRVLEGAVLDVAALAPVADGGVGGLLDQGLEALIRAGVLE